MSHKKLLRGSPRDIVKLFCLVRQLRVMASIKHRVVRDRQNQQELRQCVPPNVTNDRSILCHIHYSTSDGRARSIKISKPNFWHRNQKSLSLIFSSSTEPHQEFLIPAIGFALYWISVKFSSKERKRKDLKREADYIKITRLAARQILRGAPSIFSLLATSSVFAGYLMRCCVCRSLFTFDI